ncbi:hypothetical protein BDZ91DRAFT_796409 [Kalaharituber pfeilii]|nr:hypothetical protein BDZ91DRAFT_796409 [Kalaharituber pfeilii]
MLCSRNLGERSLTSVHVTESKVPPLPDPMMRTTGLSRAGAFSSWMMRRSKPNPVSHGLGAAAMDAEERMARQIWELKNVLRSKAVSVDFWQILLEGLVEITGAQCSYVSRRAPDETTNILGLDDHPGEEPKGAGTQRMVAIASYQDDGKGKTRIYHCQEYVSEHSLTQDQVILIPHSLSNGFPIMANAFSLDMMPYDAILSVPISHGTEHIGQMGILWTRDGLKSRASLTWGCIKMFLHALEDLVQLQVVNLIAEEQSTTVPEKLPETEVPHCCKMSFKPYARSVSHELRTPMQGVVGMLDLIQSSIKDLAHADGAKRSAIIQSMAANIEVAQDSSMRAIYAADNMVHAYDLDMEIPSELDLFSQPEKEVVMVRRNSLLPLETAAAPMERSTSTLDTSLPVPPIKVHKKTYRTRPRSSSSPPQGRMPLESTFKRSASIVPTSGIVSPCTSSPTPPGTVALIFDATGQVLLNSRPVKLRQLLHDVVHECLRIGNRPERTKTIERELGELVVVTMKGRDGNTYDIKIELIVSYDVPDFIMIDELALKKLISCVFHNAVKFCDSGWIQLHVSIPHPSSRFVIFSILDTGCGIKSAFLPNLFKPFSREDPSITRSLDGLGLGLMVAKGLARKMGGDVWCEWTSTKGPMTGAEFRIRLPISPGNTPSSLPGTPLKTPGTFIHSNMARTSLDNMEPLVGSLRLDARRIIANPVSPPAAAVPPPSTTSTRYLTIARGESSKTPSTVVTPPSRSTTRSPCSSSSPPPVPSRQQRPTITLPPPIEMNFPLNLSRRLSISYRFPNLRVLVAEDNTVNRKLAVNALEKLGLAPKNIVTAADGLEAIRAMEEDSPQGEPDISLVLMDLWMPRCDGYEAAKKILAMQKYKDVLSGRSTVTILAVSADVTRETGKKAMEVGMMGFVAKPYRMVDLERILLEHVNR